MDAAWCRRAAILTVLGTLALLYILGWARLRRAGRAPAAPAEALVAYLAGVAVVGAALLSRLALLQERLLSAHMVQHELLMIAGPPLLLLGRPLATTLWGTPSDLRQWAGRRLSRRSRLRAVFDALTRPAAAWTVSAALLWVWHAPYLYDAVQASLLLHDAQHLSFFAAGLLFWWPVVQAAPFSHRMALPLRVGYLAAGIMQRSVLGGVITLSDHVLYPHYLSVARSGGLAALQDQRIAGGIMWFVSGTILCVATITAIWRLPDAEAQGGGRRMTAPARRRPACGLLVDHGGRARSQGG